MNKKLSVWQQEDYVDDSGYAVVESDDGSYFEVVNRNTEEILLTDPIRNEAIKRAYAEIVGETPQAPTPAAPVDVLKEKNERIAALEADVKELRLERLALERQVETLKYDDALSDEVIMDLAAENERLQARLDEIRVLARDEQWSNVTAQLNRIWRLAGGDKFLQQPPTPAAPVAEQTALYEEGDIKLYRGDKLLIKGDSALYVLKLSHKSGSIGELVADSDWHLHYGSGSAFIAYRKAYLDYLKEHSDINIHPYSGEVVTADNHARISEEIAKLREYDEVTASQAAPVAPASGVTLSEDELPNHDADDFTKGDLEFFAHQPNPEKFWYYRELSERQKAAIAARRAELDKPQSQDEYNKNRPYIG